MSSPLLRSAPYLSQLILNQSSSIQPPGSGIHRSARVIDLVRPDEAGSLTLVRVCRWILPGWLYITVNKVVMSVIFGLPLVLIALFESQIAHPRARRLQFLFNTVAPEDEEDPKIQDPENDDPQGEICRVSFEELVKQFPECVEFLFPGPPNYLHSARSPLLPIAPCIF